MKISRSIQEIGFLKESIISVGTFDGIHKAHQMILKEVVKKADAIGGRSVIVTFDPHPREVLGKDKRIDLLSTFDEKTAMMRKLGISNLLVVPFTYNFSRKSFIEFYKEFIITGVGVSSVIEGHNHHLGRDREGSMDQIVELGKEYNFTVSAISLMNIDDRTVSSSTIRTMLQEGNISIANAMLGREYDFSGIVVRGRGMGRKLGYPTANIKLDDPKKLIPKIGVYAVTIKVHDVWYKGMMSIGVIPTFFEHHDLSVEVNIFDFDEDIYDESVTVRCIQRTRDEKKFASVDELIAAMGEDKNQIEKILQNYN